MPHERFWPRHPTITVQTPTARAADPTKGILKNAAHALLASTPYDYTTNTYGICGGPYKPCAARALLASTPYDHSTSTYAACGGPYEWHFEKCRTRASGLDTLRLHYKHLRICGGPYKPYAAPALLASTPYDHTTNTYAAAADPTKLIGKMPDTRFWPRHPMITLQTPTVFAADPTNHMPHPSFWPRHLTITLQTPTVFAAAANPRAASGLRGRCTFSCYRSSWVASPQGPGSSLLVCDPCLRGGEQPARSTESSWLGGQRAAGLEDREERGGMV